MDTRTKIVDLAEELIRTRGFDSFSYKDISHQLNIKNAAIHYHFPAKADLGKEVISLNRKRFKEETERWASFPSKLKIQKFIGIYETSINRNLICFMGALGPSFEALPENMKSELALASHEIRSWLRNTLEQGKEKGELRFIETIEEKADLIISSLLSSLILTRVTNDKVLKNVSTAVLRGI